MSICQCSVSVLFSWLGLLLVLILSLTATNRRRRNQEITSTTHPSNVPASNWTMAFQLQVQGVISKHSRTFHRYQAVWQNYINDEETAVNPEPTRVITRNATVEEWVQSMLTNNETFVAFLNVLQQSPFDAFFFEGRPVNSTTTAAMKPFAFVLVDAPDLYRFATSKASPLKFAKPLANCTAAGTTTMKACAFESLHPDTILVSPQPPNDTAAYRNYSNLATFCRFAPRDTVRTEWQVALQTYWRQVQNMMTNSQHNNNNNNNNIWLSTAGQGVPWLHLRIAQQPRYYTYAPFRDEP